MLFPPKKVGSTATEDPTESVRGQPSSPTSQKIIPIKQMEAAAGPVCVKVFKWISVGFSSLFGEARIGCCYASVLKKGWVPTSWAIFSSYAIWTNKRYSLCLSFLFKEIWQVLLQKQNAGQIYLISVIVHIVLITSKFLFKLLSVRLYRLLWKISVLTWHLHKGRWNAEVLLLFWLFGFIKISKLTKLDW